MDSPVGWSIPLRVQCKALEYIDLRFGGNACCRFSISVFLSLPAVASPIVARIPSCIDDCSQFLKEVHGYLELLPTLVTS